MSGPFSRLSGLVLILGSTLMVASLVAQTGTVTLSKTVRKALDGKWKGWGIATVAPQAASCRAGGGDPPSTLQADFDVDGTMDTALAVKTSQGVRLVVVLNRGDDSVLYDVDSLDAAGADAYIGIEKSGAPFKNPPLMVQDNFPADTLTVYRCGQERVAYFWTGMGFSKRAIP